MNFQPALLHNNAPRVKRMRISENWAQVLAVDPTRSAIVALFRGGKISTEVTTCRGCQRLPIFTSAPEHAAQDFFTIRTMDLPTMVFREVCVAHHHSTRTSARQKVDGRLRYF